MNQLQYGWWLREYHGQALDEMEPAKVHRTAEPMINYILFDVDQETVKAWTMEPWTAQAWVRNQTVHIMAGGCATSR